MPFYNKFKKGALKKLSKDEMNISQKIIKEIKSDTPKFCTAMKKIWIAYKSSNFYISVVFIKENKIIGFY